MRIFLQCLRSLAAELCRSRSTGVDSGRSQRFSAEARPGVDNFGRNRTRSRSDTKWF